MGIMGALGTLGCLFPKLPILPMLPKLPPRLVRSTKLRLPGRFQISDKCCNFAATSLNILRHNDLYERLRHEITAEAHETAHRNFASRHYPFSYSLRVRIPGQRRLPVRLAPHSQKCLSDVGRHLSVLERTIFRDLNFCAESVCRQRQSDTSFQNLFSCCHSADGPRFRRQSAAEDS